MYGKHYASTYDGSMLGAGTDVFAVWGYVIANTVEGQVELNPALVAFKLGATVEQVERAIAFLCAPDPRSRNPAHQGCRLIREGEFAYHVPSHQRYRGIRNEAERREYNRIKKAEQRQRERSQALPSRQVMSKREVKMSAHTEAETEAEAKADDDGAVGKIPTGIHPVVTLIGLPPDYHTDYAHLRRSVASPESFDIELRTLLAGVHPRCEGASPEDVGRGLRELTLSGRPPNSLANFVRVAMKNRLHPATNGTEPGDEWEQAAARLKAKNDAKRRTS